MAVVVGDATEQALVDAIEEAPDELAPRVVYADYLLERGDPRGELLQVQLQRASDPIWAHDRLEGRERALVARIAKPRDGASWMFDRGRQGLVTSTDDLETIERLRPRWLGLRLGVGEAFVDSIRVLVAADAFAAVRSLDLEQFGEHLDIVLQSRARPRCVRLPWNAAESIDRLRDAPLFDELEELVLLPGFDDERLRRMLTAPWARRLQRLSLGEATPRADPPRVITDAGVDVVARLPALRRLDARTHPIERAGIDALVAHARSLEQLTVSLDALAGDDVDALAKSRLARAARLVISSYVRRPDPIVAFVSSPLWRDGMLDLSPLYDGNGVSLDEVLDTLARADLPRLPIALAISAFEVDANVARRVVESRVFDALRHVDVRGLILAELLPPDAALESLRIHGPYDSVLQALLEQRTVRSLRRLAAHAHYRSAESLVDTIARSSLQLEDLEVRGRSTTDKTERLVRSPVLERAVDVTLALEGNHASKVLTNALLETPYLQSVQRLELAFASNFKASHKQQLAQRYGAALRIGSC